MNWISIKDKLPKDIESMCEYDWVFVFGNSPSGLPLIGIAQQTPDNKWEVLGGIGAHSCHEEDNFKPEGITHWARNIYPVE